MYFEDSKLYVHVQTHACVHTHTYLHAYAHLRTHAPAHTQEEKLTGRHTHVLIKHATIIKRHYYYLVLVWMHR